MQFLLDYYVPESVCFLAQASLTAIAIIRIRDNQEQFPVKQLGPAATITAILCFFFCNLVNLVGRILIDVNHYNDPLASKQCFTQHLQVFIVGILFNILRQLPFVLFALKTLRVSICFWPFFNRMYVEDINKRVIYFFKSEAYIIYFSILYVVIINMLVVVSFKEMNYDHGNYFIYQFFCHKHSSWIDIMVSSIRLVSFGLVFFLSLWTYDELDFKKFLFLIFFCSNLTIIPRAIVNIWGNPTEFSLEIYYTTYIVQLLDTVIMVYYSGINQELTQPAMQGVLQSWEAFHNLSLGMNILEQYALYRDDTTSITYNFRCLESYTYLDTIIKISRVESNFDLKEYMQVIEKILQRNQYVQQKLGHNTVSMKAKAKNGTLQMKDLKKVEKILSDYCEFTLFAEWKKTNSYQYLKKQFINNGDINEKLQLFKIPIS